MSDILQSNNLNIRKQLIDLSKNLPYNDVAICLSAGVDSQSICFALLEAGKNVTAYSFTLQDRESRDFVMAREVSKLFDIQFVPVILPTDVETLKKDVLTLHSKYKCKKKTEYECSWPFLYLYPKVKEPILAHGIGSDGHFCLSKKGMMHFKDRIEEYRDAYWQRPNGGEKLQHEIFSAEYNKLIFEPYKDKSIIDYFRGTTWDEVNKPKQKQPILNSFPEYFDKFKVYPHTNYQLGDSGISELFELLLTTDFNKQHYKSVVGIFNAINRGDTHDARKRLI